MATPVMTKSSRKTSTRMTTTPAIVPVLRPEQEKLMMAVNIITDLKLLAKKIKIIVLFVDYL